MFNNNNKFVLYIVVLVNIFIIGINCDRVMNFFLYFYLKNKLYEHEKIIISVFIIYLLEF